MAFLKQAKTEEDIKKLTLSNVKKAYNELALDYNKLVNNDFIICPCCGEAMSRVNFYSDKRYAIGVYPECKKCILAEVEQRKKRGDPPRETKESVKRVLQKMDLPYIDSLYESSCKTVADDINERGKKSPFLAYLVPIKSLPQYKDKTWMNSEFELGEMNDAEEIKIVQKTVKSGKKRFGPGYSAEDYMFLENEYQDWVNRYTCEEKGQELLFKRICCTELEIDKAHRENKSTKDLDKTLQELMGTLGIKPSQKNSSALTDSKTFSQLIEIWEREKPIPEPEDEFKDVDKIGLYIDVFFKGHLSKMMGLKNAFSSIYEKFIRKYTVSKPQYEEEDTEILFEQIFGKKTEDDL